MSISQIRIADVLGNAVLRSSIESFASLAFSLMLNVKNIQERILGEAAPSPFVSFGFGLRVGFLCSLIEIGILSIDDKTEVLQKRYPVGFKAASIIASYLICVVYQIAKINNLSMRSITVLSLMLCSLTINYEVLYQDARQSLARTRRDVFG